VILNRHFHIGVALILNEESSLGTSLNNRTCSEAEASGHQDRRNKGRSRYSPCFKKLSWSIIEFGEKINENN
jgi:hypothetical protein